MKLKKACTQEKKSTSHIRSHVHVSINAAALQARGARRHRARRNERVFANGQPSVRVHKSFLRCKAWAMARLGTSSWGDRDHSCRSN